MVHEWEPSSMGVAGPIHPEALLPFSEYCRYYSYPVQEHEVITEDGYILGVFRVQKKNSEFQDNLPAIILQHGLTDSSDTFLINDEDKAMAFVLANAGYDVWLSNSRGNKHSRKHIRLNPDADPEFWAFTFQNMSIYDLPAVFQYVNIKTGQPKIHYVGHSQGTMIMHIALSLRLESVEKYLGKYFGFGPVAYIANITSPLFKLLDKSALLQWYHLRHIYEFAPSMKWFETDAGVVFCSQFGKVCADLMYYVMNADPELDNYDRYDVMVGHDPSGTSVQNMEHWKQIDDSKNFQAYNYGSDKLNMQHYNSTKPPMYDLSKIRMPIHLFAGSSDELADPADVQRLWSELDDSAKAFLKTYNAGHTTFIWGKDVTPWFKDLFDILGQKEL